MNQFAPNALFSLSRDEDLTNKQSFRLCTNDSVKFSGEVFSSSLVHNCGSEQSTRDFVTYINVCLI